MPEKGRLDAFERFMKNSQARGERNGYVLEGCVREREAIFLADLPDVYENRLASALNSR